MMDATVRGERARQILEDDVFLETVERLRATYIDRLEAAKTNEATIDCANEFRALSAFLSEFKSVVTTGNIAANRVAK